MLILFPQTHPHTGYRLLIGHKLNVDKKVMGQKGGWQMFIIKLSLQMYKCVDTKNTILQLATLSHIQDFDR